MLPPVKDRVELATVDLDAKRDLEKNINVINYKAFPTIISEFKYDMIDEERNIVIKELNNVEKKSDELIIQTNDTLGELIPEFSKQVFNISKGLFKEVYKYKYDKIQITGMWANKLVKGDIHPPHTHSNNILSGVYYLESDETAGIQFFDPRPQAHSLFPNIEESVFENSGMLQFNSTKGHGIIFPAWLQHWVPKTNNDRISISWNILLRGDYGQPGTLQNSHI